MTLIACGRLTWTISEVVLMAAEGMIVSVCSLNNVMYITTDLDTMTDLQCKTSFKQESNRCYVTLLSEQLTI